MPLLEVENLHVTFSIEGRPLYAVRGVTFHIQEGESVGIVGESGSGKTAVAQAIKQLSPGSVSGRLLFRGIPITSSLKEIGMVFQDPMTSLNPTMKIGRQIGEGLIYHRLASHKEAKEKAIELLRLVGIAEPELRVHQYPHEFSGGMRQRALIAIALACNPSLLIADELTTALDGATQLQVLGLIQQLQKRLQMSVLLISHDFGVIRQSCERVLVMYAGKIVEQGSIEEVLQHPQHPYTELLLHSLPEFNQEKLKPLASIDGSPPDLKTIPEGCSFKERCPYRAIKCNEEPSGPVACWRIRSPS
ncbi:MAG: hypothetical protein A3D96_02855 [Chlamydiae bacterium RIFCSPHIGHO2_12_FULL_44_59]|nr:MAG: hypothetical protein A2796_07205 [Chlamydiae bacterium RIFCSPHIGHO2_01_FULL_44_39]OGN61021.1 MAG: hypothetical protein A3D96_02855 [Chlamydiae bacterium RIFCSPHIGHO2_12_FULL_44_59]OGN66797.1 MAG: hypothetical protein A2978_00340 [Chlamydiae bacterium RIFCSPLOWO2_01_FULL_44_52]OGN69991.1 MAG: hypothetical protein A3I67_01655 [Chlamydiae bacterium RIFCSPLOWO2_02_FULL_45_22]OGN71062.1 MAG: hypothetical protein A3F79_05730 [Chlamydiae bacterium RIFCSPLOWO2_12_FULL_45_20]